jgi:hypothetical protein
MQLPKAINVTLCHNDHATSYQSAESYINDRFGPDADDFETKEEMEKAIATNSIWTCQWYPRTPVAFLYVAAATLEECVAYALRVEARIKEQE